MTSIKRPTEFLAKSEKFILKWIWKSKEPSRIARILLKIKNVEDGFAASEIKTPYKAK